MLKKTNIGEIYKNIVEGNVEITDNTICGKCSKCGECCMLVMQNRLCCPYYNGKKCLIYEVRPLICKEFYCNKKVDIETAKKFKDKEYILVNMWEMAKEIERQRKSLKSI